MIEETFVPQDAPESAVANTATAGGFARWPAKAFYAWGFGGQYIVLVPSADLIVGRTSASTVAEERRTHRRSVDDIIEYLIVAPLADGSEHPAKPESSRPIAEAVAPNASRRYPASHLE